MAKKYLFLSIILSLALALSAESWLGIIPRPLSPAQQQELDYGLEIYQIQPQSPAAESALDVGDIILQLDGEKLYTTDQYFKMLSLYEVGERLKLRYQRAGKKRNLKLSTADRRQSGRPYLGVFPIAISDLQKNRLGYEQNYGLYLNNVIKGSPAYQAGLRAGDILMKLDGHKLVTMEQLLALIKNYQVDQEIELLYFAENKEKKTELQLGLHPQQNFLRSGIDFLKQPNNVFLYRYSDEDSLQPGQYDFIINGEEIELPDLEELIKHFSGFEEFLQLNRLDLQLDSIDFENLAELEVMINGKILDLPEKIEDITRVKLQKLIEQELQGAKSYQIEIKASSKDEDISPLENNSER
ncbi:MAG: PDZ domain-containing protein [Candidatus Cloacimonadales bacterium]